MLDGAVFGMSSGSALWVDPDEDAVPNSAPISFFTSGSLPQQHCQFSNGGGNAWTTIRLTSCGDREQYDQWSGHSQLIFEGVEQLDWRVPSSFEYLRFKPRATTRRQVPAIKSSMHLNAFEI